jgi:hypothetical protein
MTLDGAKKAASVPLAHQSLLAGALMAAELVKRTNPSLERASQGYVGLQASDVRAPFGAHWMSRGPNRPVGDCICQDPDYRAVYDEKWKESDQTTKDVEPGVGAGFLAPST